jgi:hypothetical protein
MYYETKEAYMKAYKKQYECLYAQLKEEGYDLNNQLSEEKSNLYNNEYKIVKTNWNAFPNEEFSQVVNGVIGNELKKTTCQEFVSNKDKYEYLGFEVGSYDSMAEYYFNKEENVLYIFLYAYDVYKPNSKTYKRHKRHLEAVFESKIDGEIN